MPTHYCVTRAEGNSLELNESQEFTSFSAAISAIEHSHDVVVIDTPGNDTYLMRLAHSMADTLVTPLNDSFLDFDVLATLDPTDFSVTGESHYAEMVREARRQRRLVDGQLTDWIVVRNRLSTLTSRNKKLVGEGINELSKRMGFRSVEGFAERVVYREFFPRGLTALDDLDEQTLGTRPNLSHVTAREEVVALLNALQLAAVRERQTPRRRTRGMVFGHGPAAAGPRHCSRRAAQLAYGRHKAGHLTQAKSVPPVSV